MIFRTNDILFFCHLSSHTMSPLIAKLILRKLIRAQKPIKAFPRPCRTFLDPLVTILDLQMVWRCRWCTSAPGAARLVFLMLLSFVICSNNYQLH